jgi:dynein heavy chain
MKEKNEETPSPYDIVCAQECEKMNCLLLEITISLEELFMGLDGALNMTDAMETLSTSLILNRVPQNWGIYYPNKKNLSSWFKDLKLRCNQLREWGTELILPKSLCLSYLFNPMSFLTAIMQLTARAKSLPLDNMVLETIVTSFVDPSQVLIPPADGAYIHGLFLEGASWENGDNDGYLIDQKLKELHPILPVIHVIAIEIDKKETGGKYVCPVYYTTQRGPTYIFNADLKMESYDSDDSKWILAGVAAILNDDY